VDWKGTRRRGRWTGKVLGGGATAGQPGNEGGDCCGGVHIVGRRRRRRCPVLCGQRASRNHRLFDGLLACYFVICWSANEIGPGTF
jgi:hypothetical protein